MTLCTFVVQSIFISDNFTVHYATSGDIFDDKLLALDSRDRYCLTMCILRVEFNSLVPARSSIKFEHSIQRFLLNYQKLHSFSPPRHFFPLVRVVLPKRLINDSVPVYLITDIFSYPDYLLPPSLLILTEFKILIIYRSL